MADLAEMTEAVETLSAAGCRALILLHCISAYPAPACDANLRTIADLAQRFALPVGLSDHTLGIGVPIAAVALGAVAIEKHVTLDRGGGGLDDPFSLEPGELAELVSESERAWQGVGSVHFGPLPD